MRWKRDDTGQVQTKTIEVAYTGGRSRKVRQPLMEIFEPSIASDVVPGTVARGSATCPVTGYTTTVKQVRE